jgi:hypothetical protein
MIFMGSSAEAETKRNEGQKETIGKDPQRSATIDKMEEWKDGRVEDWKNKTAKNEVAATCHQPDALGLRSSTLPFFPPAPGLTPGTFAVDHT